MGKVKDIFLQPNRPVFPSQLVTLNDLESFKAELLVSIKELLTNSQAVTAGKKWLKSYQVKKLLNISTGTLQTFRNNRTIPFTRIGGIIYYDAAEIESLLLGKRKEYPRPVMPLSKTYKTS